MITMLRAQNPSRSQPIPLEVDARGWYVVAGHYRIKYPGYVNPPRQGVRYTEAEDYDLLDAWTLGKTTEELALIHGRTVSAIAVRLQRLELALHQIHPIEEPDRANPKDSTLCDYKPHFILKERP
jgi:hypothetical protein